MDDRELTLPEAGETPPAVPVAEIAALHAVVVKRILVALDASLQSLAALDAAVELAINLQAELEGLFVEDIQLLHAAGLPFAREVRYLSSQAHTLVPDDMERELRVQAERARQQIERRLEAKPVTWQFRVARGGVAREVVQAAGDADLLVLGRSSRPHRRRGALGSTARAALHNAPRSVLVMHTNGRLDRPTLFVVFDGSAAGERAVELALRLSAPDGHLHVLLIADDDANAAAQHAALGALGPLPAQLEISRVPPDQLPATLAQLAPDDVRALIVPVGTPQIAAAPIQELADTITYPLLIVR